MSFSLISLLMFNSLKDSNQNTLSLPFPTPISPIWTSIDVSEHSMTNVGELYNFSFWGSHSLYILESAWGKRIFFNMLWNNGIF
jgi:hypothetical protein